jgi:membrane associated rhomboid family serine protease
LLPLPLPTLESFRKHPFVWSVALLSVAPYMILLTAGLDALAAWFAPGELRELRSMPWRLLTPVFVHYTALHLFTNLYLWWYFGSKIEERARVELLLLFIQASLAGNLAQWLMTGSKFGGLSGVTYALLAYCWGITLLFKTSILQLDKTLSIVMLLLLPLAASGLVGNYSNAAHAVGLLCGAAMASVKYFIHLNSKGSGNA